MKISDIAILILIIVIISIIIYRNTDKDNSKKLRTLKNSKISENKTPQEKQKSKKDIYKNIENEIIKVLNIRFNYNNKLGKEEEKLLYPNYKGIAKNIIDKSLKFYDIYDIEELVNRNAFDFISSVPALDSQLDRITNSLQLNSINYLLEKHPNVEPLVIIKYIKSHADIFPMIPAVYKNDKLFFNKEQLKILNNFK